MNLNIMLAIEELFTNNPEATDLPEEGVQQIGLDEGLVLHTYPDEFGNPTIGFGHTPAQPGEVWTLNQAFNMLISDINTKGVDPVNRYFPWVEKQGIIRKWVLVNMAYNEGIGNLLMFTDTLSSMENLDLHGAIIGMMSSKWYNEVTTRARQLMFQYWQNVWCITPLTSKQDKLLSAFINGGN